MHGFAQQVSLHSTPDACCHAAGTAQHLGTCVLGPSAPDPDIPQQHDKQSSILGSSSMGSANPIPTSLTGTTLYNRTIDSSTLNLILPICFLAIKPVPSAQNTLCSQATVTSMARTYTERLQLCVMLTAGVWPPQCPCPSMLCVVQAHHKWRQRGFLTCLPCPLLTALCCPLR